MIYAKIYFSEDGTISEDKRLEVVENNVCFFGASKVFTKKYLDYLKKEGVDKNKVMLQSYILDFLAKNNFTPISETFFYKN